MRQQVSFRRYQATEASNSRDMGYKQSDPEDLLCLLHWVSFQTGAQARETR